MKCRKQFFKCLLYSGLALLFFTCDIQEEYYASKSDSLAQSNLETVSFEEAKNFFLIEQQRNNPSAKGDDELLLTPDWETLEHQDLFKIDKVKLTLANAAVNRKGNYESKLIFIKANNQTRNAIYTIYKDEESASGAVKRGRVFLNEIDGTFIDGYTIEKGKFAKRFVVKNKLRQKAAFMSIMFQTVDTEDDCWNTDNLPDDGELIELDEFVGTAPKSGSSAHSTGSSYSIVRSWNNSYSSSHGRNYSSGGGYSGVMGSIYANSADRNEENIPYSIEEQQITRICSDYKWKGIGNAQYANISNLYVIIVVKGIFSDQIIEADLGELCISIPYASSRAATNIFNDSWENAKTRLV
ncbi:hypothetical protein [Maribacter sp. 2307ULW6-5]|uniref:hypothetical protein n=1 Tax=Maribacter sp. 2307ULW6-5 TaxID=3386275 RepID=UPI0039BD1F37